MNIAICRKIIPNLPTFKHYNITYALGQCTKVQRTLIYPTSALYLCHLSSLKDIALFRTHRSVYLTSYCILPKYIYIHNIEHLKKYNFCGSGIYVKTIICTCTLFHFYPIVFSLMVSEKTTLKVFPLYFNYVVPRVLYDRVLKTKIQYPIIQYSSGTI